MVTIPRLVVAAAGSGQGKTSIATGLLGAFRARGRTVSPHKVGPDYIDPGYHGLAAGRPGRNLDPWLVGEEMIVPLFVHGATTPLRADLAIVEGVMGLFDGVTGRGDFASSAHVARLLAAPIVLVVDGSGVGRSVAALVHGFASFDPTIRIGGVILNRVGTVRHEQILREAVESVGVPVLGAVYRQESMAVPSRHLGLIPAAERSVEASVTVDVLATVIGTSVDLEAIEALARSAPDIDLDPSRALLTPSAPRTRIAVAAGSAFTFGYAEQAELLAAYGGEVVTVDPLRDETLPQGTSALVIGGGFPEVHAAELSANDSLRHSIKALAARGAPIAAECAGLLYLARELDGHPMCGVLDAQAQMTPSLSLGYREAVAPVDSVLAPAGTRVHGHEFHRTTCSTGSATAAWQWQGHDGVVLDGVVSGGVHASYLHLHWAGNPQLAQRFVDAAVSHSAERAVSA